MSTDLVLQALADRSPRTSKELDELVPHGAHKARSLVRQGWAQRASYGVYAISSRGLEAVACLQARDAAWTPDSTENRPALRDGAALPLGAEGRFSANGAPTRRRQVLAEAPRKGDPTTRDGASPAMTTGHSPRWS